MERLRVKEEFADKTKRGSHLKQDVAEPSLAETFDNTGRGVNQVATYRRRSVYDRKFNNAARCYDSLIPQLSASYEG